MASNDRPDLLLINPGGREQIYQELSSELAAVEPPIWAGLLATFARQRGLSVEILDANAEGMGTLQVARHVADRNPLLTAVVVYGQNPSASTMVMPAAGGTCEDIRRLTPEQKVMMVGGHAAALPERTLREEAIDFVCDGEGPYTIVELVEQLKSGSQQYNQVRGLLFLEGDEIVHTEPAPLVTDLDGEMPGIAWDLLPMDKYRAHNWHCFGEDSRTPYAAVYTTLGCPYKCDFCCIHAPFKTGERALGRSENANSYRRWSPEVVVDQIGLLVEKYGVKHIKFADELFVLNKKHINGICDLIVERGYDLNIWCYARVDFWTPELLATMKRGGINWVCLGIESGSERVRDDVHKGYGTGDVQKCVEALDEAGISVLGNYVFGLPEDDVESMQETLDLALELNCEFANFYCAMAYPGSRLYERSAADGLPLPESWTGYSQHAFDTLPLPTKYLSGAEVLKFRDEAFHAYFGSERYLAMMSEKFSPDVVAEIKAMASHRLKRKYA